MTTPVATIIPENTVRETLQQFEKLGVLTCLLSSDHSIIKR
jgi:hypothetical protein